MHRMLKPHRNVVHFCPLDVCVRKSIHISGWCNGNTRDFGSLIPGSNPGPETNLQTAKPKRLVRIKYQILPLSISVPWRLLGESNGTRWRIFATRRRANVARRLANWPETKISRSQRDRAQAAALTRISHRCDRTRLPILLQDVCPERLDDKMRQEPCHDRV